MYTKMESKKQKSKLERNGLHEELEIPNGISAKNIGDEVILTKDSRDIIRKIPHLIKINILPNKIIISSERDRKKEKKLFGTICAHLKNNLKGFQENFKYKLQVINVHFPMNVSYDKSTNEIVVKNFLGEKKDRRIKILGGVEVKINKDIIELESPEIEKAGQSATLIELGTKVRKKDRRIYQDGIFIIEKPGRKYL